MQTYVNEAYIAGRLRLARRLQFLGFGILFAALILTLLPTLGAPSVPATTNATGTPVAGATLTTTLPIVSSAPVTSAGSISPTNSITETNAINSRATANLLALLIYYVGLIVGFQILSTGQWMSRKWRTNPRADQQLADELKGATNKYAFYNYIQLPREEKLPTPPLIDHLIQAPEGFVVVQMQPEFGTLTYARKRWNRRVGIIERLGLIGSPPLGDPGRAVETRIFAFKRWLASQGIENVLVEGVIVFNNPRARVEIKDEPPYPVINHHQIVDYLREMSPEIDTSNESEPTIRVAGDVRNKIHSAILDLIPAVQVEPVKEQAKATPRAGARPTDQPQPQARSNQPPARGSRSSNPPAANGRDGNRPAPGSRPGATPTGRDQGQRPKK
jgi:hypothetical protein